MRTRPRIGLMAAALFVLAPGPAAAQEDEAILAYDVVVDVQRDGWLHVTETIRVRALGREVRRGIYRDFPTRFPGQSGLGRVVAPFEVASVRRNGASEPNVLQSVGGPSGRKGIRVRVGDPDILLDAGEHTYEIAYRTARWLVYGDDADQLYWNVTGNGWAFPIESASATILFPATDPPPELGLEGWTGPEGSTARDVRSTVERSAEGRAIAIYRTTAPLGVMEGLTVRVTFPKGVVDPPSAEQLAEWRRLDWGPFVDGGLVVALVLAVYLLLWFRVGRDPEARPVMVRYEPPESFSPAALGYLRDRAYRPRQFVAAVVSLAVQGALRIEKDGRKWRLHFQGAVPETASRDERRVYAALSKGRSSVRLSGTSNATVRKAAQLLRSRLRRAIEGHYFLSNRWWFAAGLAVTFVGFGALVWRTRFSIPPEGWFMGFWLSFWSLGVGTLLTHAFHEWSQALSGDPLAWVTAIFTSLFSIPFVGAEIFVGYLLWQAVPQHLVLAALVLAAINVLFYDLLERPTLAGRGVLNELEGFEEFLGATDADRLRRLETPEGDVELFERHLPYAIALGVEDDWANRFGPALERPTADGSHTPGWYGGGHTDSMSAMASSLGGAFSSSLSASSAAPSSSGGGGGGGSSGGGGGGGGGGGW